MLSRERNFNYVVIDLRTNNAQVFEPQSILFFLQKPEKRKPPVVVPRGTGAASTVDGRTSVYSGQSV